MCVYAYVCVARCLVPHSLHLPRMGKLENKTNSLISNYIQYKVWDEITYPFPNFNGEAVEVWNG